MMISIDSLKKIHNMIQMTVAIAMIGMGIVYFFISKNIFKEMQWLIMSAGLLIINAGRLIDAKYFENSFSWKKNLLHVMNVPVFMLIVAIEIKKLWL